MYASGSVISPASQYITTAAPVSTVAAPAVAAAPAAAAAKKGDAMRVTIVPYKPDSKAALQDYLKGAELKEALDKLAGQVGFSMFFTNENFVVTALYDSMENLDIATATNASVFGKLKDHFAGAPTKYQSNVAWLYTGSGKLEGEVASRVSVIPIKPGAQQAILDQTAAVEPQLKDKAFADVIDIRSFFPGGDKMVVVSRWANEKALAASDDKYKEIMGSMAANFTGAPEKFTGTLAHSIPAVPAAPKKKKAKKQRKCCS